MDEAMILSEPDDTQLTVTQTSSSSSRCFCEADFFDNREKTGNIHFRTGRNQVRNEEDLFAVYLPAAVCPAIDG